MVDHTGHGGAMKIFVKTFRENIFDALAGSLGAWGALVLMITLVDAVTSFWR